MNRLTHGPGCVKAPTIWAITLSDENSINNSNFNIKIYFCPKSKNGKLRLVRSFNPAPVLLARSCLFCSGRTLSELDHGHAVNEIFLYKFEHLQASLYHKMFIIRPQFVELLMRFMIQLGLPHLH